MRRHAVRWAQVAAEPAALAVAALRTEGARSVLAITGIVVGIVTVVLVASVLANVRSQVALLFRETSDGGTKVSLRSNGDLDVNAIARQFGGGGHIKASGAVVNAPLAEARSRVLQATRNALRSLQAARAENSDQRP